MPDRPGVTRFVPLAVVACALVLGVLAVSRERHAIADALGDLRWWSIPASFAAYVVGLLAIFRSWLVLLDHTGSKVSARSARRVYLVGQAGKYLPGSIWSVISQVQLGREYGISRVRMASASLVALAVSVTVALSLGCVLLPFSDDEALARYWFALPVAAAFVFLLWQPVLNLGVGLAARVTRVRIDHTYRGGAIAASAGWAGLANLFFGVHIFAIAQSLGVRDVRGYILSTCAYALAAGLGVVIVIAPAGAGVREAVMVAVLAPVLTFGQALTVALLSRVVATVVDLGAALAQLRGRRRHSTQAEPVFLTRRFPPSVGGMETLAAGVWTALHRSKPGSTLIAHGGSNRSLVWWLPVSMMRLTWLISRGRVSFLLTGDAPTFAIVEPLLRLARIPRATMILGLDVTYDSAMYRAVVLRALRRAPHVIAISNATREAAVAAGASPDRLEVLRLGTPLPDVGETQRRSAGRALRDQFGLATGDVLLVTVGRLVRRKGTAWFVGNVLPKLPVNVHYVVAGGGPEHDTIVSVAETSRVSERVHLLGRVSDEERETLMLGCDLFIQPNISVPGDMEGFGLVTIEAAVRGAVVVAADLEGIKDAVVPGRTGILLPSGDSARWVTTIAGLVAEPNQLARTGAGFQANARDLYSEEQMATALGSLLDVYEEV